MQPKHVIDLTQAHQRLTRNREASSTQHRTNPQRGQDEEDERGPLNHRRRNGVATRGIGSRAQGRTSSNPNFGSRGTGRGSRHTGHSGSAQSRTRGSFLELEEGLVARDPRRSPGTGDSSASSSNIRADEDDSDDEGATNSYLGANQDVSNAHTRLGEVADQITSPVVGTPLNQPQDRKPQRVTLSHDTFEVRSLNRNRLGVLATVLRFFVLRT